MSEGAAKRCSHCDVDWPTSAKYDKCPLCERTTWRAGRTQPIDYADAEKLTLEHMAKVADEAKRQVELDKIRADFEEYYYARELPRFQEELAAYFASLGVDPQTK